MTARRTLGPEANVERVGADLYRETRSGFAQFRDFLKSSASGGVLALAAVAVAAEPGTLDLLLPASALYAAWVLTRRVILPLRLPRGARRLDYNHPHPKGRRPRMAAGILYLGQDFKTGQELWISNEDGRQHVAVPGTTGAGKTAALVSLCANALSWGSGFIFVDGKADNRLYADVLALARMYGREDDVLALNFLVASGNKDSGTFNPFAWGNADVIREILVSQIEANPNGGDKGGNHVFMARAVALLGALTPALVWMRDHKGVPIDIESIRFATELESIVALAIDKRFRRRDAATGIVTDIPVGDEMDEALLYPLRSYLGETGGYDKALPYNKQKSDEPAKQHSFVVMHFSATFTQLAVSLGHIFKCEIGDIDMRDVVLNRRILVVNLPTLENSGETTASLGRLVVASLRNMMAQTLGADLEGDYAEIVENKPHLAPTPFPVVFDEVGYYVVPGMDKMLAMGRGLGFMFYLGFQEVAGLRQRIGDAMYSLLGNANLQILMRLQEGSETRKYVEQTAGDTHVTQASSFQANEFGVFRESMNADVRQTPRVNWSDLRGLIEGEAVILLGKDRVYAKLFHAEIDAAGPLRMNRPLMLRPPETGKLKEAGDRTEKTLRHLLAGRAANRQDVPPAPTLDSLVAGFAHRAAERPEQDFGTTARAAILALSEVAPGPSEAVTPAPGPAGDPVTETEHTPMVQGVSASDDGLPTPDAPRSPAPSELSRGVALAVELMGSSPADAQVEANSTMALREMALDSTAAEPELPDLDLAGLRGLIEGLAHKLASIGRGSPPLMRAAE